MYVNLTKKGFSLLQVMVALALLAAAITSVFAMNAINTRRLRENRLYLAALITANEILEQASRPEFVSVNLDSEVIITHSDTKGITFDTEFLEHNKGKVLIKFVKNDENVNHIYIEIKYKNAHGRETEIGLRTGVFNDVY
ncbi:MAG: hypothetical protein WC002_08575 [Candidatus Muiribacteriota bacterium]|jgi:type II secretory pathway pseudopilin PulG